MGPHPEGGEDRRPSMDEADGRPVADPPRRAGEVLPLAALTLTTLLLAASAFRVVASSIVEAKPASPVAASIPDDGLLAMGTADGPWADGPPPPPRPSPTRSTPPAPSRPSILRVVRPPSPGLPPPRPRPDRASTAPPPPVADAKPPATRVATAPAVSRRILVRDESGKPVVARVLGKDGDRTAVLLPDGQVGWPDGLIDTDKPFAPATKAELRDRLTSGEFAGFHAIETGHYLVLYQGTRPFAQASANLLENLYTNLGHVLDKRGVPVHDAEFPLVAVIFKTEADLRRRKPVAPDVQAYYEILSNRIFLYESSAKDRASPEVAALLKPQTVAHEGAHQVLQNIGVQARLSSWPLWLVEGLAEYCASPRIGKNGSPTWVGLGQVNLLHMAAIRDLADPLSTTVAGAGRPAPARDPRRPMVEYLVTRTELTPTDYALSWALAYHLAMRRTDDFLDYLREMSKLAPFERRSPEDHLRAFKAAFGPQLGKLDADVAAHLRRLKQVDALPYYAVMFEQALGNGMVRRSAFVSQSPSVVRQWIESSTAPDGAEPRWQIFPHPTKARAMIAVDQWMGNG